jgi:hypothetical protein
MTAHAYHLRSRWIVDGTVREVSDVIGAIERLPQWWPSVHLDVSVLARGNGRRVGRVVDLETTGWLPHTLRWRLTIVASREPYGWIIATAGDLTGPGAWRFTQDGPRVIIDFDWQLTALSSHLQPILTANFHWAMARGKESLQRELARVRASGPDQRRDHPPPGGIFRYRKPMYRWTAAMPA